MIKLDNHTQVIPRLFSVAPMLDWTDRHCRYFLRLISPNALLYTEMVTTGALIFGKGDYLSFDPSEHPLALQLGGSNPQDMARCARKAEEAGYDEVNINVGCPSNRVQNGRFGACLMAEPQVVADCVVAMQDSVNIPVTVKCRIGIDDMDEQQALYNLLTAVSTAGCQHVIVHARKAWLQGLSPKENRDIPPLNYPLVHQAKWDFPHISFAINGGIKTLLDCKQQLPYVDEVMLGREVYSNPFVLQDLEQGLLGCTELLDRDEVVLRMNDYVQRAMALMDPEYARPWPIIRHMMGVYQSQPGGRIWRRYLSQHGVKKDADANILLAALEQVRQAREAAEQRK